MASIAPRSKRRFAPGSPPPRCLALSRSPPATTAGNWAHTSSTCSASRADRVRILVYEFASGGGLGGRDMPASLAREGAAMRAALVADLSAIGSHEIVTTADGSVPHHLPTGVDVVALPDGDDGREIALERL